MKKFLPYILIVIIVAQLFAPFSVGSGVKNSIKIKSNIVEAIGTTLTTDISRTDKTIIVVPHVIWDKIDPAVERHIMIILADKDGKFIEGKESALGGGVVENGQQGYTVQFSATPNTEYKVTGFAYIVAKNSPTWATRSKDPSLFIVGPGIVYSDQDVIGSQQSLPDWFLVKTEAEGVTTNNGNLDPNGNGSQTKASSDGLPECSIIAPTKIGGCFAQGLYYLFFKTTSLVFTLAGKILDVALMYSISDVSYRSSFVTEGWGIMRDFCNMFFIFVLLYIAFGTILKLHGVKTKEMIINVVIIGLLINFSLFATQVIIDASNILTRVFYNQKTIVTGAQKDASGNTISELGEFGEIKLSEAIVSKVDPQKLIIQAKKVGEIQIKGTVANENDDSKNGITTGNFIIVVFLATAVNIVGALAFLTSGFIFIGRVLGLWIAMILAPLAFFSYIVPSLKDIKMVGWSKWWPDTLKLAFLGPVFAFFMYLIVGFMDKGLGIFDTTKQSVGLGFIVSVVLPFIFIMVLLMKAKDIAKDLSGEIGSAMSKAGSAVGGATLGLGLGTGALAMRGTVGRLGNKLATSEWAKTHGVVGRTFGSAGKWAGSKSFDVRNSKIGAAATKSMEVDAGKGKEGGYAKHISDKVERRQKRAKELEVGENETLKQNLNAVEEQLQSLNTQNSHAIEQLDKRIKGANDASAAAAALLRATDQGDAQYATRQTAARDAAQEVINLRTQRSNIKNGTGTMVDEHGATIDLTHNTHNGNISKTAVDNAIADANRTQQEANASEAAAIAADAAATAAANAAIANATAANMAASATARAAAATARATATAARTTATAAGTTAANYMAEAQRTGYGNSMNDYEDHIIPDAHHELEHENIERRNNYADSTSRWGGKANREAAHKIRMGIKVDTKEKH